MRAGPLNRRCDRHKRPGVPVTLKPAARRRPASGRQIATAAA
jgi:hypothetical protein